MLGFFHCSDKQDSLRTCGGRLIDQTTNESIEKPFSDKHRDKMSCCGNVMEITADKSECTVIKKFSSSRYDVCPPKHDMLLADGRFQAENNQLEPNVITEWCTRSGLYPTEQCEGGMKGLCSVWATGPTRSWGKYTVIPKAVGVFSTTYCQIHCLDWQAGWLWKLHWADNPHFCWCRLVLLLRFAVVVTLLSLLMLMGNLCSESHLCGSMSAHYELCYGV